jgi:hypothetical protein
MTSATTPPRGGYFPAIACIVCDSPIDALVALCVRRNEAMMLVAASWQTADAAASLVATLHGGRRVAVLPTPEGRWAACNAFVDELFATPQEAGRKLAQLLKRGRYGYVGYLPQPPDTADGNQKLVTSMNPTANELKGPWSTFAH